MATVYDLEQGFRELEVRNLKQQRLVAGFFSISPSIALYILENNNSKNRKISISKIRQTSSDILSGKFLVNGESVIFDRNGLLLDGQHRLFSCVETGVKIVSLCAFGIDPEAMQTIDLGKVRTSGDVAQISGIPSGNAVAAIARMMIAYDSTNGETLGRPQDISSNEILEYLRDNPDISHVYRWASTHALNLRGICSATVLCAARIILHRKYGPSVMYYLNQVGSGINIGPNDPAFVVRRRLFGARRQNGASLEAILRGGIHFVKNRSVSRVDITGRLPVID